MTLGEKIRDCRREMHLTQQALAEGIVTRNMLSQIENGTAQPSLDTLTAFASRLDVPVGRLLGEENDPFLFRKATMMPHLFKLMRAGKYAECLSRADMLFGERDDDEPLLHARQGKPVLETELRLAAFCRHGLSHTCTLPS